MSTSKTLILGAGPTGLSAAFHLGPDAILTERERRVGGWCRSVRSGGFTFDLAGHIMFSNEPYVHGMYRLLLGDNVHWQEREAWIFSKNVYTRYPFQGALYGLPPKVIQECLIGAIESRFGALKSRPAESVSKDVAQARNGHANGNGNGNGAGANGHGASTSLAAQWMKQAGNERSDTNGRLAKDQDARANGHANGSCSTDRIQDCCADGILESEAPLGAVTAAGENAGEPRDFEEFIYKVWGAGIAKHFAIPYNRKLWAVPLSEMETSWLGGRVPLPDLEEMIEGALSPVPKPMGPNARFGYPLRGGFQALMDGFLPHLRCELELGREAVEVSPSRRTVTFRDGSRIPYDVLLSTIPLPNLIASMGAEAPPEIHEAARGLRHVSVRCVNLGIGRPALTEKHWIYYPEDTVFHRIFVQGNASPHCNAPGGFGLTCEITYSEHKPLPCDGDDLVQRCIDDCRRVGIVAPDDPVWTACQTDLPHAYVVYDHGRKQRVDRIREWLLERDIVLAGRYSEWEYYNSDHAFIAGRNAANRVREIRAARGERTASPPSLVDASRAGDTATASDRSRVS